MSSTAAGILLYQDERRLKHRNIQMSEVMDWEGEKEDNGSTNDGKLGCS